MKKGFTLIELLSVIVVIAIISIIAVPALTGVINKARLNALKDTAYGLIESSNLYYAQYQNSDNIRFDIINNKVVSNDTTNILKYKGTIKDGVSIIKNNGQTVICVTDGKNSAYKNFNESRVNIVSGKECTIPDNTSIVYLDGERTIEELTNQELTDKINSLEQEINRLKNNNNYATKEELTSVNNELESKINGKASKNDVYPVGSIYMSANNVNPATLFGGTWAKIEGRFLLSSSSSYALGSTGGNTSVSYTPQGTVGNTTLTINQIPSHTHESSMMDFFTSNPGTSVGTTKTYQEYYYLGHKAQVSSKTGGSQAHNHSFTGTTSNINVMNPYVVVNVWKRTA